MSGWYYRNSPNVKVVVKGDLEVEGKIDSVGDITSSAGDIVATAGEVSDQVRSMAADRTIYNSHVHTGVTVGPGSTGTTPQTQ